MPFSVRQVYKWTEDGHGRQGIVLRTRSEGQEGLLRYVDTRVEEWVLWNDFEEADKWHRVAHGER